MFEYHFFAVIITTVFPAYTEFHKLNDDIIFCLYHFREKNIGFYIFEVKNTFKTKCLRIRLALEVHRNRYIIALMGNQGPEYPQKRREQPYQPAKFHIHFTHCDYHIITVWTVRIMPVYDGWQ